MAAPWRVTSLAAACVNAWERGDGDAYRALLDDSCPSRMIQLFHRVRATLGAPALFCARATLPMRACTAVLIRPACYVSFAFALRCPAPGRLVLPQHKVDVVGADAIWRARIAALGRGATGAGRRSRRPDCHTTAAGGQYGTLHGSAVSMLCVGCSFASGLPTRSCEGEGLIFFIA